jgi:intracellular septation protein
MQQILEFIPVALFFIAYSMSGEVWSIGSFTLQFDGIYTATAVLMAATLVQLLLTLAIKRTVEKRLLLLAAVILATGGLTLVLHNKIFIQWKPTIFNWILAAVFLGSSWFGERKTLLQRMLGSQISLPENIWQRLNHVWIVYFILVGIANLVVAYEFSESIWVSYKLYSSIGFTLLISAITAIIMAPHLKEDSGRS